jgi:hypothetical protein
METDWTHAVFYIVQYKTWYFPFWIRLNPLCALCDTKEDAIEYARKHATGGNITYIGYFSEK